MHIYTGRAALMEPAMLGALREAMQCDRAAHIVVVPKQLTLQTERTLLAELGLRGSFSLQVLSPERLCARIFDDAGLPDGARVDECGRVMLVRAAIRECRDELHVYRSAERRKGFAEKCARQIELIRQARMTPEALAQSADALGGRLGMKLRDLGVILKAYEARIEGRYQDGESEFMHAVTRAGSASFLRDADVTFYGFDLTPPTLHALIAAVGAVCPSTRVFLPLENDTTARDFDVFEPMRRCYERLYRACDAAGVTIDRVRLEPASDAAAQHPELRDLSRELFAFPAHAAPKDYAPKRIQMSALRDPVEECRFAAALCRRLAMTKDYRWGDILILCHDIENYHQPLKAAFRAYGVPLFLSSSRPAARHAVAECLCAALSLIDRGAQPEDATALMHTGFMPMDADEVDRLSNHIVRFGLKPYRLLRPLTRGTEAEIASLEPVRARFAAPLIRLRDRLKRADSLRGQLTAIYEFLTDIDAAAKVQSRVDKLISAGLREAAGEESQVWNRIMGALDQMAELMGDEPMPIRELRDTLNESLEAAVIKPLPQSGDAVYAQTSERMLPRRVRALIMLGENDRSGADADGLLSASQVREVSSQANVYLGLNDDELSRLKRYYTKCALEMTEDYLCVCYPLSGMDNGASRPGQSVGLIRAQFPGLRVRGGVTGDEEMQRMMLGAPAPALTQVSRALAEQAEGTDMAELDAAALAGLHRLWGDDVAFDRIRSALNHAEAEARLNPQTARALYGALQYISISRLEQYAKCPFAFFTQYGLKPQPVEPYALTPMDEGSFFHDAVHAFLMEMGDALRADPGADREGIIEDAKARMSRIVEPLLHRMAQEGPLGDTAVTLAEQRRLKATAINCAVTLCDHLMHSKFRPTRLETDFGREDGAVRLVAHAETGDCALEGRVDRIDSWAEGGYLRVIDYKRGGKTLNLDAVYHGQSLQLPVYLASAMKREHLESAGVYYFNLSDDVVTTQETDPALVERDRMKQFRMTGLSVDDLAVLEAADPDFERILNVSRTKDGLKKNTAVTDKNGFDALTKCALRRVAAHVDDIRGGRVDRSPSVHRHTRPCTYCSWRAACLFDDKLDAPRVRRMRSINAQDALTAMKLEED